MRIFRSLLILFGVLALGVAVAAFAAEVAAIAQGGSLLGTPLGKVWFEFHRSSLQLLEAAIVRHLYPPLWEAIIFPLLQRTPLVTAAAFGALGLILLWLGRLGRRRT
ncbi:MAG: hypothetical protein KIT16_06085 [Rhodospirillaceae bacterium]|nr:hypothetical protein [Rhodospirillaceae bacterium]